MEKALDPWAMFHSTDMGDDLEEVVEAEDCKVLRMKGHSVTRSPAAKKTGRFDSSHSGITMMIRTTLSK